MQKKKQSKKRSVVSKRKQNAHPIIKILRYLPALLILLTASSIHGIPSTKTTDSTKQVLSYATNMSINDLLSSSNEQRSNNNVGILKLNNQLNSAAQTKANDMVVRNYWSHTTPDGVDPWTFITNTGYQYITAGENLAYGFDTGTETTTGWMNSPPHRQNLLNSAFSEVGYGFANSKDYVNSGPQTVVVAMYASPITTVSQPVPPAQTTPTSSEKPAISSPAVQSVATKSTPVTAASSEPIQSSSIPTPTPTPVATTNDQKPVVVNTPPQSAVSTQPVAATSKVRRIQILTGGNATWSSTLLVLSLGSVGILWILQKGLHFRRMYLKGERYVLQHLHIDFTILSLFVLAGVLLQTTGVVR